MKIVISYSPNHPVLAGLVPTLQVINEETVVWLPQNKAVYDMIEEVKPDIIFMDDQLVGPSFISAMKENPHIKVVLFGVSFASQLNPSLTCLPTNIAEHVKNNLINDNIEYIIISRAANIVQYRNGTMSSDYECDVFYWSVKPVDDETFDVLCDLVQTNLKVKIGGPFKVPLPQYVGNLDIYDVSNFMVSADLALDFNYISELDYVANKTKLLRYPYIPTSKDIIEFIQLNKPNFGYDELMLLDHRVRILKNHTYFHRLNDIFKKLKMDDLAQQSLKRLEDFI